MVFENLTRILNLIRAARERSGREEPVGLVAVTKYASLAEVRQILATGLVERLGESRVQEARAKIAEIGRSDRLKWHMIGRLQTNKARPASELFDMVESLDSLRLAEALERPLAERGAKLPVLIQVKLAERETQGGIPPEALPEFLRELRRFPCLRPSGLMAIAPMIEPLEGVRPYFQAARRLFEANFDVKQDVLSMGMSRDFELAVEEGATLVRIGRAILESPRPGPREKGGPDARDEEAEA